MGFVDRTVEINGVKQKETDWGGTIAHSSGGSAGIATMLILIATILLLPIVGLLWFSLSGHKIFYWISRDIRSIIRVIATLGAIAFAVVVFMSFQNSGDGLKNILIYSYSGLGGALLLLGIHYIIATKVSKKTVLNYDDNFITEDMQNSAKKSTKIILKIFLVLFILIGTYFGAYFAILFYNKDLPRQTEDTINYNLVSREMTPKEFDILFTSNYEKSIKKLQECKNIKFRLDLIGEYSECPPFSDSYSIEYASAIVDLYHKRPSESIMIAIIENLGNLDAGYSKELANFMEKYLPKRTIIALESHKKGEFDIEKSLKENNQIPALKVYLKLKKKYNIKE